MIAGDLARLGYRLQSVKIIVLVFGHHAGGIDRLDEIATGSYSEK